MVAVGVGVVRCVGLAVGFAGCVGCWVGVAVGDWLTTVTVFVAGTVVVLTIVVLMPSLTFGGSGVG
jgi:hypothetical protein